MSVNNMNNINICKLTPEKLDDYLYFFENVAHTDNKEWDRCYFNLSIWIMEEYQLYSY